MAVGHEKKAKMILAGLATRQVVALWTVGIILEVNRIYDVSVFGPLNSATSLLFCVDLQSPQVCECWFEEGIRMTDAAVSMGLLSENISRLRPI